MKSPHQIASGHSAPTADRWFPLRTVALCALVIAAAAGVSSAQTNPSVSPVETASACASHGGWIDVKTGRYIDRDKLFGDLAANSAVVLLGDSHTSVDNHHWQLHYLGALYGRFGILVRDLQYFW